MNVSHVPGPKVLVCESGQLVQDGMVCCGRQVTHAEEGELPGGSVEVGFTAS